MMGRGKGHAPTGQAPHLPMVRTPVVVMVEHVHEMLPRLLVPTAGFAAQVAWVIQSHAHSSPGTGMTSMPPNTLSVPAMA